MTIVNCEEVSATRPIDWVDSNRVDSSRHFLGWGHCFRPTSARCGFSNTVDCSIGMPKRPMRGMTLIELLVVTVLVSILVSTAIPVLSPNNDTRKIREASRAVNSFLATAQSKAIETGRPFGVTFKRLSDDTDQADDGGVCIELQQVEVPPTYTGFDENSLARLAISSPTTGNLKNLALYVLQFVRKDDLSSDVTYSNYSIEPEITYPQGRLSVGYDMDLFPPSFFRKNDLIETHGQIFRIVDCSTRTDSNGFYSQPISPEVAQLMLAPLNHVLPESVEQLEYLGIIPAFDNNGNELPSPEVLADADGEDDYSYCWTTPAPYRVMRQPVPSSGEPLQLPGGMAIDLGASGVDLSQIASRDNRFHTSVTPTNSGSPTLLFTPSGGVQLQLPGEEMQPVIGSIALCVGRRELIPYESVNTRTDVNTIIDQPIDLRADIVARIEDTGIAAESEEVREIMNQYNWLNLDTRWVVLSGRSGSITSIATAYVDPNNDPYDDPEDPAFTVEEQLAVALSNAPSRQSAGGR